MDKILPRQKTFDLDELMDELRCGYTYLLKAIGDGRLKAHRVARRWLIAREDVLAFLDAEAEAGRKHRARD